MSLVSHGHEPVRGRTWLGDPMVGAVLALSITQGTCSCKSSDFKAQGLSHHPTDLVGATTDLAFVPMNTGLSRM